MVDRGERRRDDRAGENVVEAADGIVLRHREAARGQLRLDARRRHVVRADQRRRVHLPLEEIARELPADVEFVRHAAGGDVLLCIGGRQNLHGHLLLVLLRALHELLAQPLETLPARERHAVHGRGDEGHMAVAKAVQMLAQQRACAPVAELDGADRQLRRLLADQHKRQHPRKPLHLARKARQEGIDDARNLRAGELLEIVPLQLRLAEGVAEQHPVAPRVGVFLDCLHELGVVLVCERGDQHHDEHAVVLVLPAAHRRPVAELLRRGENALLGLVCKADLRAAVEDQRNARLRDARQRGDFAGGRFLRILRAHGFLHPVAH